MKLKQFQVDAFAFRPFTGNPAAVCLLEQWPEDALLQAIAEENNLSETAFLVANGGGFDLRWFTPRVEVELCGHGTLAAAHVVFEHLNFAGVNVVFSTLSGPLTVARYDKLLVMDFPASSPIPCPTALAVIGAALGKQPAEVWEAEDYLAVFSSAADVRELSPDFEALKKLDLRGVIVTAAGDGCDFVSRVFGPKLGVDEDPVTGSAHCQLAPFWATRLGKTELRAKQVSRRGGEVLCQLRQDGRVLLTGGAVTFMIGEIEIPNRL